MGKQRPEDIVCYLFNIAGNWHLNRVVTSLKTCRGVSCVGAQAGFDLGEIEHRKGDMNSNNALRSGYLPKGC
jgi:hypothetical protein